MKRITGIILAIMLAIGLAACGGGGGGDSKEDGYPGEVAEPEPAAESSGSSDSQQLWNGSWYGKMGIMEGTGKYDTDLADEDMYMVVDLDANGKGTFTVYSSDYGEWGSGTCEAAEHGLRVVEGVLEYSPEPMVPEDWSFFWSSYEYEYHIVNTATFIDYDGDEFEFTIELRPWGADWEDYVIIGRAWTYPPGYDFYMEKLANGEPSPWGSFGPGYDGSGGGSAAASSPESAGTDSDDDAPATSSGGSTELSYEMDGVKISVVLPSSDWIDDGKYGSAGSYSVIWYYKNDYSNSPRISLEIRADTSSFDKRINGGENRKDIANRTIGGVDMKGASYDLYGMEWIEYIGKVNADNFASIRISRVDIESGEGKAVLDSIKFN